MSQTRRRVDDRRQLRAAVAAAVVLAVAVYAAFVREWPLSSHFEIRGQFATANQLRPGDEVRRAGVRIGHVVAISHGPSNTSTVTLRLDDHQHLHANASLAIRERLLFEGNLYVEVIPGTPAAPALKQGATIPLARTTVPVQLDQVLDTLDTPVRQALTQSVATLADGLGGDAAAPSGAQGLRRAVRELDDSLSSIRTAAVALRGTRAGDLHRAVASTGDFTAALGRDPAALAGLVTHFNRVAAAMSANPPALSATIRQLDAALRAAPTSLRRLDAALPSVTRFAHDLRPALLAVPSTVPVATGLLHQLRLAATRPGELPAFVRRLQPLSTGLRDVEPALARQLALTAHAAQCLNNTLLPVAKTQIPDGPNTTGYPIWKDGLHLGANLLGASAGFDGNGGTLRLGLSEGVNALQEHIPGIGELIGQGQIEGVNPIWLGAGVQPQYRPDAWCENQVPPNFAARSRIGLPANFTTTPARQPTKSQRDRQRRVLSLMTGNRQDRAALLRMLLRQLPLATTPPHLPGPTRPPVLRLPSRRPAPPTKPPAADPQDGNPVTSVVDGVKTVLDKLLGRERDR